MRSGSRTLTTEGPPAPQPAASAVAAAMPVPPSTRKRRRETVASGAGVGSVTIKRYLPEVCMAGRSDQLRSRSVSDTVAQSRS